ncbi:hypothetical protein [Yinghuangia sp. YIM S09857]|uniref:hypothetical protein n=1 Tax=Yinghuangia sp. YIM S09857 TaxID=3436929 RepID=UPI003F53AE1D
MRRKLTSACLGIAAVTSLVVGTGGQATAAGDKVYAATINNNWRYNGCAVAWFESYGEKFRVYDGCADGHSTAVKYRLDTQSSGAYYKRNYNGAGTTVFHDNSWKEGRVIYMQACVMEGAKELGCGAVEKVTA